MKKQLRLALRSEPTKPGLPGWLFEPIPLNATSEQRMQQRMAIVQLARRDTARHVYH